MCMYIDLDHFHFVSVHAYTAVPLRTYACMYVCAYVLTQVYVRIYLYIYIYTEPHNLKAGVRVHVSQATDPSRRDPGTPVQPRLPRKRHEGVGCKSTCTFSVCMCIYTYIYTYIYVCMYACMYVCMNAST